MSEPSTRSQRARKVLRRIFRLAEHVFAAVGLLAVVYWLCFNYSHVASTSMQPTLQGNDKISDGVLTEKVSYWFRNPRRWEVVAFHTKEGTLVMKRVVALPGEKIQMPERGRILIDGKETSPPPELRFLRYLPYGNLICGKTAECGDGYYVLGDDSRDSDDSRFNGPLQRGDIIGRAWLILDPSGRRGFVR
jgi:signal peptidase I